ncbi:dioxygenase [Microbacterium fluvii]|uniref:Dioxygenase n=1 Tax=Microbacterium fluvii TaxID=415215 RepID=A0ABW2HBG0_9MICO|nr:dioxygenase [Microbacterium fluvii]MCU4672009.1 dioxygenase [Microbacterium fluvii]
MAAVGKDRAAREARERARLYQARQQLHEAQEHRRTRDNVMAAVIGAVLIVAILGAQWAYFSVGPGQPVPTPSATSTPAPTDSATPEPTASDAATPTATP